MGSVSWVLRLQTVNLKHKQTTFWNRLSCIKGDTFTHSIVHCSLLGIILCAVGSMEYPSAAPRLKKRYFFKQYQIPLLGPKSSTAKKKASQLRFSKDLQHAVHCCGNVSQPTSQPWLIQSAVTRRKMNVREVVMKLTLCLSKGSCHTMTHGLSYPCVKFPQDGWKCRLLNWCSNPHGTTLQEIPSRTQGFKAHTVH